MSGNGDVAEKSLQCRESWRHIVRTKGSEGDIEVMR